ncbi:hypothetical protein [Halalkalirubrum salinum]|uniref:hypothetical protein n=1 Tax=Halalkalirubrum salinum TaxID=2563889 RepID=UPI0010FB53D9|nr:hypothetical protein [Halalkalirubrum salinum]
MSEHHERTLAGRLRIDEFSARSLAARAASAYETLLAEGHDPADILVLKRFPSGTTAFERDLAAELSIPARPNVESVLDHAASIHAYAAPDEQVLSDYERYELLRTVINGWNWSTPYLKRAAEAESFGRDVGRVLLVASWGGFGDRTDDDPTMAAAIEELEAVQTRFREALAERSSLEQAQLVERARDALSTPAVSEFVSALFDAVLVVDFEEFGSLERSYLSALTTDAELYCLGERDASVQRIWNESGSVESIGTAAGLQCVPTEFDSEALSDPAAIGRWLASGALPDDRDHTAYRVAAETFAAELEAIAEEIEALRDQAGYRYEDFAVLLRDINQPVHEARSILRRAGVSTASATVEGLSEDPAIREIHALIRVLASDDAEAMATLEGRTTVDAALLETIRAEPTIAGAIDRWIVETDLKDRIADEREVDAYGSYRNIREIRDIAAFFDGADFLAGGYQSFLETLERAIQYVAPDQYTTELSVEENGVLVDPIRVAKYDSRSIVFLVDVVEGIYPPDTQTLTRLFPTDWVKRSAAYPGVTTLGPTTVSTSFSAVETPDRNAYDAYYTALSRRQLAVGARVGTDRLYLCTADRGTRSLGRRRHPSRFLRSLEALSQVTMAAGYTVDAAGRSNGTRGGSDSPSHEQPEITRYTPTGVAAAAIQEPWRSLSAVERAASLGDRADMRTIRERLAAIAELCDREDVEPRFRDAVYTQIDMANGDIGTAEERSQ